MHLLLTSPEQEYSSPRRGLGSNQIETAVGLYAARPNSLVVRELTPAEDKLLPLQLQPEEGIGADVLLDLPDRRILRHIARNRYPVVLDVDGLGRFNSAHGHCILIELRGAAGEMRLDTTEEEGVRKYLPELTSAIQLPQISHRMNEPFLADANSGVHVLRP